MAATSATRARGLLGNCVEAGRASQYGISRVGSLLPLAAQVGQPIPRMTPFPRWARKAHLERESKRKHLGQVPAHFLFVPPALYRHPKRIRIWTHAVELGEGSHDAVNEKKPSSVSDELSNGESSPSRFGFRLKSKRSPRPPSRARLSTSYGVRCCSFGEHGRRIETCSEACASPAATLRPVLVPRKECLR